MRKKVKILVLGSMLYDCVTWGDRLPRKGETVVGYRNGFFTGGKGANQAVQAARMGADVYMIGLVGKDAIGEILITALKKEGINTKHITVTDKSATGTCCIHVDKNGDNAIMTAPQANLDISVKSIDEALDDIQDYDIFLTQLEVNINTTVYAIRKIKERGKIIVFNPAPAHKIPLESFKYADYISLNQTETEFYSGVLPIDQKTCVDAAKKLKEIGMKNILITLGSEGVFYSDKTSSFILPAYKVLAVDATAAGDAFNAAFTTALGGGMGAEEALLYGNAAGAFAASKEGAQSSLGYYDDIENLKKSAIIDKIIY